MTYGLTPQGLIIPSMSDLLSDVEADQRSLIDAGLDQSPDVPLGQLNNIFCEKLSAAWETLGTINTMLDPNNATDRALDVTCAITGTKRQSAYGSTVCASLGLNANVTVTEGSIVSVAGNAAAKFQVVGPWGGTPGDIVSTTAGTYLALMESLDDGPVVANAGTLTVIESTVAGWNSCTNALDAELGSPEEGDEVLRPRRQNELAAGGSSSTDAIEAALLEVPGVIQANVFENVKDIPDTLGRPPHSIEAVIFDGLSPQATDASIAQAIWNNKAGGGPTTGTSSATAFDADGDPQIVAFTRVQVVPIYIVVNLQVTSDYPSQGDAMVKAALVANTYDSGETVVRKVLEGDILTGPNKVAGVADIASMYIGFAASPSSAANLAISPRQIAALDTSRITVNHV